MVEAIVQTPETLHTAFLEIDTTSPGGARWPGVKRLDFAFFTDEEWSDEVSANYSAHDVIGRSEAYQVYQNTTNRSIPLNLTFHAQGGKGEDYELALQREVRDKVDWCRALAYPIYDGNRMFPPPAVLLYLGTMYTRLGDAMRCIVESVNVSYTGPVSPTTHASHGANVSMQFMRVAESASKLYDVKRVLEGRG